MTRAVTLNAGGTVAEDLALRRPNGSIVCCKDLLDIFKDPMVGLTR